MAGRRWVPVTLAALSGAAILVLLGIASGRGGAVAVGPMSLSVRGYLKPLAWGAAAAAALLIMEWRRPAWRYFSAAALAVLGSLGLVNFAASATPIVTDADIAVSELYVELATKGQLLVGPYSRFGWHHPGPLYFYLVAPFYALAGHQAAAMYAVALGLNLAALVVIACVLARETGVRTTVTTIAIVVFFAWRVPRFLASPWTAHVPILASLAFLVVSAAVGTGRRRLLVLMLVFGSLAMQTHVSFAPVVVIVSAGVVATLVFARHEGASPWPAINAAAWVLALVWLVPVSEALAHGGGNLAALWRFFVSDPGAGHSLREAIVYGSYGLMGIVRPDLELPWGGHVDLTGVPWAIFGTAIEVGLLAVIARRDLKAGRHFEGRLALVALAATAVAVWSLSRVRDDILNHEVFKLSAFGALNLGVIAAAAIRGLPAVRMRRFATPLVGRVAYTVLLAAAAAIGFRDLDSLTSFERRQQVHSAIVPAFNAVRDYALGEGVRKPLIRVGPDRWGDAAGVLLRLRQSGMSAAVTDSSVAMFTEAFAATGDEDAMVTLADLDLHRDLREQPGITVLLSSPPLFVDAARMAPARSESRRPR
jgi:hypothetical protein